MAVYYKFKSSKDFSTMPLESPYVTVYSFKQRIFSKHLKKGRDFDIIISNADTNEDYVGDDDLIFKNTSVVIRRMAGLPMKPILVEQEKPLKVVVGKVECVTPPSSTVVSDSSNSSKPAEVVSQVGGAQSFGRGLGGLSDLHGLIGQAVLERNTPPTGYICHRCGKPGHFIQHCPTNGDPNYDVKRVRPQTGIPGSMLSAIPAKGMEEGLPSTRPLVDIPPELHCSLCKEAMKDAVLTKCCFGSFCDKCIREYLITKQKCACGASNIVADDLIPNITLRCTINRILESSTSSTGSLVHVQDGDTLPNIPPLAQVPASNDESKPTLTDHPPDVKEPDAKVTEEAKTDASDAKLESTSSLGDVVEGNLVRMKQRAHSKKKIKQNSQLGLPDQLASQEEWAGGQAWMMPFYPSSVYPFRNGILTFPYTGYPHMMFAAPPREMSNCGGAQVRSMRRKPCSLSNPDWPTKSMYQIDHKVAIRKRKGTWIEC